MTRHKGETGEGGVGAGNTEKRFATSLLEKLLEYLDKAASNMRNMKPASRFSRRHSFSVASEDVKFFGKVRDDQADLSAALLTYLLTYLLT